MSTPDPQARSPQAAGYATVVKCRLLDKGCCGLFKPVEIWGWSVQLDGVNHKPFRKLKEARAYAESHNKGELSDGTRSK
jgi:hypothetical protein